MRSTQLAQAPSQLASASISTGLGVVVLLGVVWIIGMKIAPKAARPLVHAFMLVLVGIGLAVGAFSK